MAVKKEDVATSKESVFEQNLKRSNSKIRADRAKRISLTVGDAQRRLVMDINDKIRVMENRLEGMLDLSSDNTTTSMNVISPDFNAAQFVAEINDLKTKIKMEGIKLQVAEDTLSELFLASE